MKKKSLLTFCLCTLLFFCLTSCGSDDPVSGGTNTIPSPVPSVPNVIVPEPRIEVSNDAPVLQSKGGSLELSFSIQNGTDWTVSSDQDWCKVSTASGSGATASVKLTCEENTYYDERNACVTITCGKTTKKVTITQKQKDAIILSSNKIELAKGESELFIDVQSNVNFSCRVEESAASWISLLQTRALSDHRVAIQVKENPTFAVREGRIYITSDTKEEVVVVHQASEVPSIVLSKKEFVVGSDGEDIKIELQSNCDFSVEMPEGNWITRPDTRAVSSYTYYFKVKANDTYDDRSAKIQFRNKVNGMAEVVTVKQVQKDAIIVAKNEYEMTYKAGNLDFDVNSNVGFKVESLVTWIKQKQTRGLTTTALHFSIDENTSKSQREGTIRISYKDKVQNIRVIQNAYVEPGINIPDEQLRNVLLGECDVNSDGQISKLEASQMTALEIILDGVKSLSGLEYFTNLKSLACYPAHDTRAVVSSDWNALNLYKNGVRVKSDLNAIDLSVFPKLEKLYVMGTSISSIDLSHNPELQVLDLTSNQLQSLDVTGNTKLKNLFITDNPNLKVVYTNKNQTFSCEKDNQTKLQVKGEVTEEPTTLPSTGGTTTTPSQEQPTTPPSTGGTTTTPSQEEQSTPPSTGGTTTPPSSEPSTPTTPSTPSTPTTPSNPSTEVPGGFTTDETVDFSKDGDVRKLQSATVGKGIDIVLMGDAFNAKDVSSGKYDNLMKKAMEQFFSKEPFKSFRNRFNVYEVTVVSKDNFYNGSQNTALGTRFGDDSLVSGNNDKVISYTTKAVSSSKLNQVVTLVLMNSKTFDGTTFLYYPANELGEMVSYNSDGFAISYIALGENDTQFASIVQHEACGHGFAKLGDEYYFAGNYADAGAKATLQSGHMINWYMNVDYKNDPSSVVWSKFLSDSRYANEGLGIYQGGFTYSSGIYRPTENSIMRNNEGQFNAPSRSAIYNRIYKLSVGNSWTYNYESFVTYDAINRKASRSYYSAPRKFKTLHKPVVIRK